MSNALVPYVEKPWTKEEQIAYILGQVSSGRAIIRILRDDDNMPSPATFWRWHMDDADLRDKVARARENGVEALLDEAVEIANTPLMGEEETRTVGTNGAERRVVMKEMLGHRRLQIETRVKYAQMIAPRKYGPKLDLTSDGEKLSSIADGIAAGNRRIEERKR